MSHVRDPGRAEAIQVMRGVAALLVVLVHAINMTQWRSGHGLEPPGWLAGPIGLNEFGASGVDLFFVISGFVMAWMLVRRPDLTIGAFACDRFLRVVPMFWIMSAAYGVLLVGLEIPITTNEVVTSITIFPLYRPDNFAPPLLMVGWSLACELAFYVVVAASLIFSQSLRSIFAIATTMTLALAGTLLMPRNDMVSVFANDMWLDFAAGLILFHLWRQWRACCSAGMAIALMAAGALMLAPSLIDVTSFDVSHWTVIRHRAGVSRWIAWGIPWTLVLGGLLFIWPRWLGTSDRGLSARRALNFLGDASYSIYLTHMFVLRTMEQRWPGGVSADALVGIAMVLSLAMGICCYWTIERPLLLALRRNWSNRKQGPATAGLAAAL